MARTVARRVGLTPGTRGEAGYAHSDDTEPSYCTIRGLAIEDAFWTYCANHPHRRPNRDPIPLGPVFVDAGGYPYSRNPWQPSPDTEGVRQHLLELVRAVSDSPPHDDPTNTGIDAVVVWQLGEFLETRAEGDLRRISGFSPSSTADHLGEARNTLIAAAQAALAKLGSES